MSTKSKSHHALQALCADLRKLRDELLASPGEGLKHGRAEMARFCLPGESVDGRATEFAFGWLKSTAETSADRLTRWLVELEHMGLVEPAPVERGAAPADGSPSTKEGES